MFNYSEISIPCQLLDLDRRSNDIHVIIGENGSGKSELLNAIAAYYKKNKKTTIAICGAESSKIRPKNLSKKAKRGLRTTPEQEIKHYIKGVSAVSLGSLHKLSNILLSIGYEDIGIQIYYRDIVSAEMEIAGEISLSHIFPNHDVPSSYNLALHKLAEFSDRASVIWLNYDYYPSRSVPFVDDPESVSADSQEYDDLFAELDAEAEFFKDEASYVAQRAYYTDTRGTDALFTSAILHEEELRAAGVIDGIALFLLRDGVKVPLDGISSGELSIVTSAMYLAANVDDNTVIVIDEPENSLHPKWQRDYFIKMMPLLSDYYPKIVVATHSPLIASGVSTYFSDSAHVYTASRGRLLSLADATGGIEQVLYESFAVLTPSNNYLSVTIVKALNDYYEGKLKSYELRAKLSRAIECCYSDRQKNVIRKIVDAHSAGEDD